MNFLNFSGIEKVVSPLKNNQIASLKTGGLHRIANDIIKERELPVIYMPDTSVSVPISGTVIDDESYFYYSDDYKQVTLLAAKDYLEDKEIHDEMLLKDVNTVEFFTLVRELHEKHGKEKVLKALHEASGRYIKENQSSIIDRPFQGFQG